MINFLWKNIMPTWSQENIAFVSSTTRTSQDVALYLLDWKMVVCVVGSYPVRLVREYLIPTILQGKCGTIWLLCFPNHASFIGAFFPRSCSGKRATSTEKFTSPAGISWTSPCLRLEIMSWWFAAAMKVEMAQLERLGFRVSRNNRFSFGFCFFSSCISYNYSSLFLR